MFVVFCFHLSVPNYLCVFDGPLDFIAGISLGGIFIPKMPTKPALPTTLSLKSLLTDVICLIANFCGHLYK